MIQELLYEYRRRELEKHIRQENVYWVTDLCRCPLKRIYEFEYPELILQEIYNPSYILGDLVHLGLEELLKQLSKEGHLNYDIDVEVENEKEINIDGKKIKVRGRADILLKGDDVLGIEIKSARGDTGMPHEHHILQCKIYSWLFDTSKFILLYITPDRVAEYEVKERASEDDIVNLIKDTRAPRWSWECRYCRFAVLCPFKSLKS